MSVRVATRLAKRSTTKRVLRGVAALAAIGVVSTLAIYQLAPQWLLRAEFARQAWQAGVSTHTVTIDDHTWSYYAGGQGSPIVLVHGFTGSKENWLPIVKALQRDHRVIIPDLPGWGESTRLDGADYGVAEQVARLDAFFTALQLPRVHLVGHSMGGHIAGVYAAEHGDRIASVALVDSAGVRFTPNAFANAVLAGETPFNVSNRAEWDALMKTLFVVPPPWAPPAVIDVLIQRNIEGHDFQAKLIGELGRGPDAFRLERELPRITAPLQVIWCRDDQVLDYSAMATIRGIVPTAQYVTLGGCGHMPMMEVPDALASSLREFITPGQLPATMSTGSTR